MRDISLAVSDSVLPRHTILTYGDTRTGKTVFGATAPRPLVIADVTEGGYSSIRTMDRGTWFEPEVEPIVKGIENMGDFMGMMPLIDQLIASRRVMSIVFDAFSFYCDFFLNGIIASQTKPDNRAAYGTLGMHLRTVRTELHKRNVNVIWNCLAKHPDTDDPKGRPMIPGQQADKFAAGVDFLLHSRIEPIKDAGKVVGYEHQLRTRQYGTYIVGNRLGMQAEQLPDPFVGTYADFLFYLGYDVDKIRASLPKPQAVTAPKPVVVAKPPIVSAPKVINVSPTAGNNQAPRGAVKQ